MKLRLRRARFEVGLRGLALLRGWPFGSPEDADAQLEVIRRVISAEPDPSTIVEVDDLAVEEAYASWADTYDEPNLLIDAEEPAVKRFLETTEPGLALDVACGTGRLAGALVDLGHSVIGVDASPEMLSRARINVPDVTCVKGELTRLPIADKCVGLVVCGLALTHVDALMEPIRELSRVLVPGGRMILSDVHPLAVATGAHAFFSSRDGSRGVARNHVHWPSAYVEAFRPESLAIEGVAEPVFAESFVEEMSEGAIRDAAREALVGLPFAIVWLVRKDE